MCEMCGCGVVKPGLRPAKAVVPVTLAAIPVPVVEPSVKESNAMRHRQRSLEDPRLRRALRSR